MLEIAIFTYVFIMIYFRNCKHESQLCLITFLHQTTVSSGKTIEKSNNH